MCCERFQERGVDHLLYSRNLMELQDTKCRSCTICAVRNLPLECSQCGIKQTYDCLAAVFCERTAKDEA